MHNLYDFLSLFVYALSAYPIISYIITGKIEYLYVLIGIVLIEIFIKISRIILPKNQYFLRPNDASNCSICNDGGDYSNRIGMPSGHVLMTTFIVYIYLLDLSNNSNFYQYICGILIIFLVALSRVKKQCHTIPQVIVGAVLGILFGYSFKTVIKNV